jgi:hypothetical protein
MKVIELGKKHSSLPALLRLLKKQPLVLTKNGKPLAALLDVARDDLETLSLRTNSKFRDYLRRCRARHQTEGGTALETLRVKYGLPARARRSGRSPQDRRATTSPGARPSRGRPSAGSAGPGT